MNKSVRIIVFDLSVVCINMIFVKEIISIIY